MPYDIEQKLVIATASSALFDLAEADQVFQEKGRKHTGSISGPMSMTF